MHYTKQDISLLFNSEGRADCERTEKNRPANMVHLETALLIVYANQTADEQASETTAHSNGIGFSGTDASFASSLAKQLLAGRWLSRKQIQVLARIMPRYWRQLGSMVPEPVLVLDPSAGEVEEDLFTSAWEAA